MVFMVIITCLVIMGFADGIVGLGASARTGRWVPLLAVDVVSSIGLSAGATIAFVVVVVVVAGDCAKQRPNMNTTTQIGIIINDNFIFVCLLCSLFEFSLIFNSMKTRYFLCVFMRIVVVIFFA
jgi:hypothetical protein